MRWCLLVIPAVQCVSVPVPSVNIVVEPPENCVLPKKLGLAGEDLGTRTFIEDCDGLGEDVLHVQ